MLFHKSRLAGALAAGVLFYMCAAALAQDAARQGAKPAVSKADAATFAKAAALAQEEVQGEADLRAAGLAAKLANALAQEKSAALAQARAQAAADPSSAVLKDAVGKAETEAGDASRAAAAAKADVDARVAALLALAARAHAAEEAAAKTKPAMEAAIKLAKDQEQARELFDASVGHAQGWFDASAWQAKSGPLIALVQVDRPGKPPVEFRYDRLQSVERVVTPEGGFFARAEGQGWVESDDWGKSGAPAREQQAAVLDAMAALAMKAFQPIAPDGPGGAVVWNPINDDLANHFEQGREHPRGDESYPQFTFVHSAQEGSDTLLRTVAARWQWEGAPADVTVYYFHPVHDELPAGTPPEGLVAQALRATASAPVKVDATIAGKPDVRVAGILSGADFDLTVEKGGTSLRQIAVGGDSWSSADGGATWQKQKEADRTYYDAVHSALGSELLGTALRQYFTETYRPYRPAGSPNETLRTIIHMYPGGAEESNGETLQCMNLKVVRGDGGPDYVSYWLAMKDGKPVALRRVTGMASLIAKMPGQFHAEYSAVANGKGVLPPPGNAEAVPLKNANEALAQAVSAMQGASVWRVDLRISRQQQNADRNWSEPVLTERIHGLFSGKEYDLTTEDITAQSTKTVRRIGIGEDIWESGDGVHWRRHKRGPYTWQMAYSPIQQPFGIVGAHLPFTDAGAAAHDGNTLLHIRMMEGGEWYFSGPEYWLRLDQAGNAVSVARCTWPIGQGSTPTSPAWALRDYYEEDFAPAGAGEKIEKPVGK